MDGTRVRQSGGEHKLAAIVIFTVVLLLRAASDGVPPFDDAYHAKRIASFPGLLDLDVDRGERGAFTPWPPLYDLSAGAVQKLFGGTSWLPPIAFALFAAAVTLRLGSIAGLALALSPYLISISRRNHIDHHFLEPALVLAILWSTLLLCGGGRPRPPSSAGRWPDSPLRDSRATAAFLATALTAAL
ncbi:MAG: hypothetical protein JJE51_06980, partial [Thermoanaerobaculia bacterium]|nr:hypothetical protein [Thermoanaerobaculia bacterium]